MRPNSYVINIRPLSGYFKSDCGKRQNEKTPVSLYDFIFQY